MSDRRSCSATCCRAFDSTQLSPSPRPMTPSCPSGLFPREGIMLSCDRAAWPFDACFQGGRLPQRLLRTLLVGRPSIASLSIDLGLEDCEDIAWKLERWESVEGVLSYGALRQTGAHDARLEFQRQRRATGADCPHSHAHTRLRGRARCRRAHALARRSPRERGHEIAPGCRRTSRRGRTAPYTVWRETCQRAISG
jgi:hypothetical protein